MREFPCDCGSMKPQYALKDAAGIFCCYVCEDCEEVKMSRYDPSIFDSGSAYASSGEEMDIGRYAGEDY